jgi:HSP20 family protein
MLKNPWVHLQDNPPSEGEGGLLGETETPRLDLYETEKDLVIEADLPGINPSEVSLRFLNNQLTLEGKRGERQEDSESVHYLRMERCLEDFRRIVHLPCAVDPQQAQACYQMGVLILRLPKIVDRRQRAIKIEIQ